MNSTASELHLILWFLSWLPLSYLLSLTAVYSVHDITRPSSCLLRNHHKNILNLFLLRLVLFGLPTIYKSYFTPFLSMYFIQTQTFLETNRTPSKRQRTSATPSGTSVLCFRVPQVADVMHEASYRCLGKQELSVITQCCPTLPPRRH